jgi:RpiR family carbohydrate utilization transcriptional regulator
LRNLYQGGLRTGSGTEGDVTIDAAAPRPGQPNILEAVRTSLGDLRPSERKVADLVLADPRRLLDLTVAETAELADVSQPTVIRFSSAVGCSGFQDFKLRLAHSLALGTPATHSVLRATDEPGDIVRKVFDYTISSLDWARARLDPAAVARAVAVLEEARSITFMGLGASGIVALDAQQKFPMFGVPCSAETDAHQQVMAATMMRPGDVAVLISHTGQTTSIIETARIARDSGARTIAITGSRSPLAAACDVALVVESLDNTDLYTPTISRVAALVVVDVLSSSVGLRKGEAQIARFGEMKRRLGSLRTSPYHGLRDADDADDG